jgi:hypothetical protein
MTSELENIQLTPFPQHIFSIFPLSILLNLVVDSLAHLLRILKFIQHNYLCCGFPKSLSHIPEINSLPLTSTAIPNHFSLIILLPRATHSDVLTFLNPLTPEFNPSAQRCQTRFFAEDFAS